MFSKDARKNVHSNSAAHLLIDASRCWMKCQQASLARAGSRSRAAFHQLEMRDSWRQHHGIRSNGQIAAQVDFELQQLQ